MMLKISPTENLSIISWYIISVKEQPKLELPYILV